MPRSQFWQMSRQSSPIDGCDSDDCSESRPSSESLTTARKAAGISSSAIRLATSSGLEVEPRLEPVVADQRGQRPPLPASSRSR